MRCEVCGSDGKASTSAPAYAWCCECGALYVNDNPNPPRSVEAFKTQKLCEDARRAIRNDADAVANRERQQERASLIQQLKEQDERSMIDGKLMLKALICLLEE